MQINLTEARANILRSAEASPLGIVERPYLTGFERVTWDRNASALAAAGLLTAYVHGGYEITSTGRDVLAKAEVGAADEKPAGRFLRRNRRSDPTLLRGLHD